MHSSLKIRIQIYGRRFKGLAFPASDGMSSDDQNVMKTTKDGSENAQKI